MDSYYTSSNNCQFMAIHFIPVSIYFSLPNTFLKQIILSINISECFLTIITSKKKKENQKVLNLVEHLHSVQIFF